MSRTFRIIDCPYKELRGVHTSIQVSCDITCMLCGAELELRIPIRVWIYIFSFLKKHYQLEHELFDEESKKYELMINPLKVSSRLNFAYHKSYANFIVDAFIKFHAINYDYAVSKLPLFNVEKPQGPFKPKMESVYRRQSIERVLPKLLEIFPEGIYEKYNSSERAKKIYCSDCKKTIRQSTSYKEKVAVMNTLISVFNTIEYLKNHIPYVTQKLTFIYINGIHTLIPLPLTFEFYLGLAQHA